MTITVEFRTNHENQTVSGLILPWGIDATSSNGTKFRFGQHSVFWIDPKRATIELNDDHDHNRVVGHALSIRDEHEGVAGTFRVTDTEMLNRVDRREITGFSAELRMDNGDAALVAGVWHVHRAQLTGVALTPQPAYVEARIRELAGAQFSRYRLELPATFASPLASPVIGSRGGSMSFGQKPKPPEPHFPNIAMNTRDDPKASVAAHMEGEERWAKHQAEMRRLEREQREREEREKKENDERVAAWAFCVQRLGEDITRRMTIEEQRRFYQDPDSRDRLGEDAKARVNALGYKQQEKGKAQ